MIAALIFVVSVAALLQFFISYCRSLVAAYRKWDLSEEAREVTGIEGQQVAGDEFLRLLQLVRLCPEPGDDTVEIRAVSSYFGLLNLLRSVSRSVLPKLLAWVEREREGCAYFAAVALDRRIAHNRDLITQQSSSL